MFSTVVSKLSTALNRLFKGFQQHPFNHRGGGGGCIMIQVLIGKLNLCLDGSVSFSFLWCPTRQAIEPLLFFLSAAENVIFYLIAQMTVSFLSQNPSICFEARVFGGKTWLTPSIGSWKIICCYQ